MAVLLLLLLFLLDESIVVSRLSLAKLGTNSGADACSLEVLKSKPLAEAKGLLPNGEYRLG